MSEIKDVALMLAIVAFFACGLFVDEFFIAVATLAAVCVPFAIVAMAGSWEANDNERLDARSAERNRIRGLAFDQLYRGEIDEDQFNRECGKARHVR